MVKIRCHPSSPVTIHAVVGERRADNIVTVGGIQATPTSTSTVKGRKIFKESDKVERERKVQNQWKK